MLSAELQHFGAQVGTSDFGPIAVRSAISSIFMHLENTVIIYPALACGAMTSNATVGRDQDSRSTGRWSGKLSRATSRRGRPARLGSVWLSGTGRTEGPLHQLRRWQRFPAPSEALCTKKSLAREVEGKNGVRMSATAMYSSRCALLELVLGAGESLAPHYGQDEAAHVTITTPLAFTQSKTTCVGVIPRRLAAAATGASTGPPGYFVMGLEGRLLYRARTGGKEDRRTTGCRTPR